MAGGKSFTSIIFFHGVGDPKRHVSISNFIDHLDLFSQRQSLSGLGNTRNFKYRITAKHGDDVANFVEFKIIREAKGKSYISKVVRVYEAYWVPQTGGNYNTGYIAIWFLSRIMTPFKLLLSKWRSYPQLRIATLCYMDEQGYDAASLRFLESRYREFENWQGRRDFRKGNFAEFSSYVASHSGSDSDILDHLSKWKSMFVRHNLIVSGKSLLQSFTILSYLAIMILSILYIKNNVENIDFNYFLVCFIFATMTFFAAYFWMSLRSYVLDVLNWTLDSERDTRINLRNNVIKFSRLLIKRVAEDPECEECIIVGHSLGTCIAMESLFKEGELVKAQAMDNAQSDIGESWIKKISEVFLVGSPIDRIFHFFQIDRTFSHRYQRVFEEQRLSLSLPPFWNMAFSGTAKVTNFWSRFDPISSKVHSLRKSVSERSDAIRNIEAIPTGAPLPIGTHTSYFSDPIVIESIYRSIVGESWDSSVRVSNKARRLMSFLPWIIFPMQLTLLWALAAVVLGFTPFLPISFFALQVIATYILTRETRKLHQGKAGLFLNREA